MARHLITALIVCGILCLNPLLSHAQIGFDGLGLFSDALPQSKFELNLLHRELLAKAEKDECFYDFDGSGPLPCEDGGKEKVNQAYIWGKVKVGHMVWFGTWSNGLCNVLGTFGKAGLGVSLDPFAVDGQLVCEFGATSPFDAGKDWKAPRIYSYNTKTGELIDRTASLSDEKKALLENVWGFRSAGAIDGVVFIGGPDKSGLNLGAITIFAFDAETGECLDAGVLEGYNDIRRWLVAEGHLYCGVGTPGIQVGSVEGAVLRWTGDRSDPLQFEEVGRLDGLPAYLGYHEGHLVATTWVFGFGGTGDFGGSGLWMQMDSGDWKKVFSFSEYEPSPIARLTTLGGAVISYKGWTYFGTMAVPGTGLAAFSLAYPGHLDSEEAVLNAFLGTTRAVSIYRARYLGTSRQQVQLLYGEKELPVYDPRTRTWTAQPTGMGMALYGKSGFGNIFNTYTWSAAIYKDKLYFGTFDWSFALELANDLGGLIGVVNGSPANINGGTDLLGGLAGLPGLDSDTLITLLKAQITNSPGGDLWCFNNQWTQALPENVSGCGNDRNYGFRVMCADKDGLYIGTANPFNLHPDGGWELLRLRDPYSFWMPLW